MSIRSALAVAHRFEVGYPISSIIVEPNRVWVRLHGYDPAGLATGLLDASHLLPDAVVALVPLVEHLIRVEGTLDNVRVDVRGAFGDEYSTALIESMPLGVELLAALTQREYAQHG